MRGVVSGVLEVQVLLPRGAQYDDTILPAAWSIVIPIGQIDAFVFSWNGLQARQVLNVIPLAYCHISEDGALSHVILAVPEGEFPDVTAVRTYEAQMARFLNRHFEIVGWGNAPAVKKLLSLRYNINI